MKDYVCRHLSTVQANWQRLAYWQPRMEIFKWRRDKLSIEYIMIINTSNVLITRNRVLNAESISVKYHDMELYLQ
jgi:hypothetical protein